MEVDGFFVLVEIRVNVLFASYLGAWATVVGAVNLGSCTTWVCSSQKIV